MMKRKQRSFSLCTLALFLIVCLMASALSACGKAPAPGDMEDPDFAPSPAETETPEVEPPHPVATASLGVVGDILIHDTVYNSAKAAGGGVYDFTEQYELVKPYLEKYDCAVANLEVTLGGEKPVVGNYPSAYPCFNCPDSILDALKGAGVDLLLTANNHSYDTRGAGMIRTVQKVREKGLEYLGTRDNTDESFYKVKDVNGIKLGMACFTYSTLSSTGIKALNGITMTRNDGPLVSSFAYTHLEDFYQEAEGAIKELEGQGAEFLVFYLHWGNEYQYVPNSYQTRIAKKLCEMGVDVIVGGHPHVIQPFETITAENGNETLCIYSTGNAISNQRKFLMTDDNYSGHTEDGMIFGVTFERWSDGSVRIGGVDIQPLWVIRESRGGRLVFQIIPLDLAVADWKSFHLNDATLKEAKASYNRTMKLVGEGLNAARTKLGQTPVITAVS